MLSLSARRLVPACILSAGTVLALAAPGVASAAEQCSGASPIKGNGSTLQKLAQLEVWGPDFNTSTSPAACSGTQGSTGKPKVEYEGTGSGPGMESWGLNKHAANFSATNAYVGTDQPPNKAFKEEIEAHGAIGTLLTIPTLQASVAIPMHLPKGCTATNKLAAAKGRLVLNNVTLEKIFRGTITKWSEIKDDGDELTAEKNKTCNPESTITRVVRLEGSGTTSVLKKYLYLINKEPVDEGQTWQQSAEALENTEWPEEGTVKRGKGGSGEVAEVAATESSIGYANLADARKNTSFVPPLGGSKKATFWPEVQHNGLATTSPTYADPASNKDVAAKASANCVNEVYTNGVKAFPPKTTLEPWNEVTTSTKETPYSLCGFTYDLSLSKFSAYPGTSPEEEQTVKDYFGFVLNTEGTGTTAGGQVLIGGATDYLGLPTNKTASKNVLKIAQEGQAKIAD